MSSSDSNPNSVSTNRLYTRGWNLLDSGMEYSVSYYIKKTLP